MVYFWIVKNIRRRIKIDFEREEGSSNLYPTVVISGVHAFDAETDKDQRAYGLTTEVRVYIENDESVHAEAKYIKGSGIPTNIEPWRQRILPHFTRPIAPRQLLATAKVGLEILTAYNSTSTKEQNHVLNAYHTLDHKLQVSDWLHSDLDDRLAAASPLLSNAMKRLGMSFQHEDIKPFFALNALNQVKKDMLPPKPTNNQLGLRRNIQPGR